MNLMTVAHEIVGHGSATLAHDHVKAIKIVRHDSDHWRCDPSVDTGATEDQRKEVQKYLAHPAVAAVGIAAGAAALLITTSKGDVRKALYRLSGKGVMDLIVSLPPASIGASDSDMEQLASMSGGEKERDIVANAALQGWRVGCALAMIPDVDKWVEGISREVDAGNAILVTKKDLQAIIVEGKLPDLTVVPGELLELAGAHTTGSVN